MYKRLLLLMFLTGCMATPLQPAEPKLDSIALPEGFSITYYATNVPGARSMEYMDGVLFVGTRDDTVYALVDEDEDYKSDSMHIVAQGLEMPNGVAYKDGSLYVAEVSRVLRFDGILDDLSGTSPTVVYDDYPQDPHHGWKFIRFGPDGLLYVPVGAPCNICDPDFPYASITALNVSTGATNIYAQGVRNSVGFDWHPETEELYFTDNGRDWFGEDIPPDELNHAPREGMHFGYPHCHGSLVDDEYPGNCSQYETPLVELGPHVAALGMRFYDAEQFPSVYRNKIFIAEHGSWNRKIPIGYRLMVVDPIERTYEVFASGWLDGMTSWGRPVDIEHLPDGSLLVSDDKADAIYRIMYRG